MGWPIGVAKALLSWLGRQPKRVVVPLVAGVVVAVVGAVVFAGYGAVTAYDYMENDPRFCRSCHTMEVAWDRWETSEHKTIACHDCHHTGTVDGMVLVLKFAWSRPESVGTHAVVQDEACKSCHESGNPRWRQVAATAGHQVHAEEQGIACTKCHSVTLHRFSPPGPICQVCHTEIHLEISGMAGFHCLACHEYLAGPGHLLPGREPCLSCHLAQEQTKVTWPAHAPMQFPCSDCHRPHEQAKPVVVCTACHVVATSKGLHTGVVHAASPCQTCHRPHEWQVTSRTVCEQCHADRVEHNVGMTCASCHSFTGVSQVPPRTTIGTPGPAPTPTASPAGQGAAPATPTPTAAAGPPLVPHTLEGRSECTACHGPTGFKPFPADHAGRTSAICLACHRQQ